MKTSYWEHVLFVEQTDDMLIIEKVRTVDNICVCDYFRILCRHSLLKVSVLLGYGPAFLSNRFLVSRQCIGLKTSGPDCPVTCCHIPEKWKPELHCCKYLPTHIFITCFFLNFYWYSIHNFHLIIPVCLTQR